jgi:signal transduction histidine kinase
MEGNRVVLVNCDMRKSELPSVGYDIVEANADVDFERRFPLVMAHPTTLRQLVMNLISNALKFHRPGVPPKVTIRITERDDRVRLSVEDKGIGVPSDQQSRIFRVFERLHGIETYPGSGIGLAIVQKAVDRMGGSCGVESKESEGSRFWIELPRAAPQRRGSLTDQSTRAGRNLESPEKLSPERRDRGGAP